jgi:hypothetical protein
MTIIGKRRGYSVDTARRKAKRASARHLRDLERAHGSPPADIKLASVAIPQRISGEPTASWCSSPARLCAELAG